MRITVFSDSHRCHRNVHAFFEQTRLFTDLYIFLGDSEGDLDNVSVLCPDKQILKVAGNCDYGSYDPTVGVYETEGQRFLYTHGHVQHVNFGLGGLKQLAKDNGATAVLFGHTHERRCDYIDGVYFINPGSLGKPRDGLGPSYCVIDVTKSGILVTHCDLSEGSTNII